MNSIHMLKDSNGKIVDSNILLKITKLEYAEEILAGKLYMNNLKYFRELEQEGVGDEEEGAIYIGATGDLIYEGKVVAQIKNVNAYCDVPVFCAISVPLREIEDNKYVFSVPLNMIKEFMYDQNSQYTAILINRYEFEKRINEALKKYELTAWMGKVRYVDDIELYPSEERIKCAFRKRKKFAYQNEWRVVVNTVVENHFILNICDISDIACKTPVKKDKQETKLEVHF